MIYIDDVAKEALIALSERLAMMRIARNDTQSVFCQRIGVSRVTLSKIERGDPSVAIGYWLRALTILDKLDQLSDLLKQDNLFERYELEKLLAKKKRKRASRGSSH